MKKFVTCLILLSNTCALADSSTLLNQAGSDLDFAHPSQSKKELKLDNPFIIQLYSVWKGMGPIDPATSLWVELIINKEYQKALSLVPSIKEPKFETFKKNCELYLLYQAGYQQSFLNKWIDLAYESNFLSSEMGIALDQIVNSPMSDWVLKNGFYISPEASRKLKKLESNPTKLNITLQALKALKSGEGAAVWINQLEANHPLRIPLAQTAILHFAKNGKLGASGKLIKNVIEPALLHSSDHEELALYFMTLARLLFQAKATAEAKKYYDLIPQGSAYFFAAKTESLWISLQEKNFSQTKGELASLELKIFNEQFHPEAYLVSVIANMQLCQFSESKEAIKRFIDANLYWAREIEKNLKKEEPELLVPNFFVTNLKKAKLSLATEEKQILQNKELDSSYANSLKNQVLEIDNAIKLELVTQWQNRKKILESALYKMKFARVELISRMRQLALNIKLEDADEKSDNVNQYSAAVARSNQLSFPRDRSLWGDELFQMTASVKNKCIKGK